MSLLKDFSSDTLVYGLGKALKKGITLLLLPLYARALSPTEYGVLDTILTFIFFVTVIFSLGIDGATGRYYYIAKQKGEENIILSNSFVIRILSTIIPVVVLVLYSSKISVLLFDTEDYKWALSVAILTIPLTSLNTLNAIVLRYNRDKWKFVASTIFRAIFSPGFAVLFVVLLKLKVFGALIANTCSAFLIFTLVFSFFTKHRYGKIVSVDWAKKMIKFGFPLIGVGLATWVYTMSDRFILLHFDKLNEIGYYAISNTFVQIIAFISISINMSSSVLIMRTYDGESDEEKPKTKLFLKQLNEIFLVISIPIMLLISIFSVDITKLITTSEYLPAALGIPILAMSVIVTQIYTVTATGISLKIKSSPYFYIMIISAVINVGLNFLFIPSLGFIGAAFASLISTFIYFIIAYVWSRKMFNVNYGLAKLIILILTCLSVGFIIPYAEIESSIDIGFWYKSITFLTCLFLLFVFKLLKFRHITTFYSFILENSKGYFNRSRKST